MAAALDNLSAAPRTFSHARLLRPAAERLFAAEMALMASRAAKRGQGAFLIADTVMGQIRKEEKGS